MKRYFLIFFTAIDRNKNRVYGEHHECGLTYPSRATVIKDINTDGRGFFKVQVTNIIELNKEEYQSWEGTKTKAIYPIRMPHADN